MDFGPLQAGNRPAEKHPLSGVRGARRALNGQAHCNMGNTKYMLDLILNWNDRCWNDNSGRPPIKIETDLQEEGHSSFERALL